MHSHWIYWTPTKKKYTNGRYSKLLASQSFWLRYFYLGLSRPFSFWNNWRRAFFVSQPVSSFDSLMMWLIQCVWLMMWFEIYEYASTYGIGPRWTFRVPRNYVRHNKQAAKIEKGSIPLACLSLKCRKWREGIFPSQLLINCSHQLFSSTVLIKWCILIFFGTKLEPILA